MCQPEAFGYRISRCERRKGGACQEDQNHDYNSSVKGLPESSRLIGTGALFGRVGNPRGGATFGAARGPLWNGPCGVVASISQYRGKEVPPGRSSDNCFGCYYAKFTGRYFTLVFSKNSLSEPLVLWGYSPRLSLPL